MFDKITGFLNDEYHRLDLWYLLSFLLGILFYLHFFSAYPVLLAIPCLLFRRFGIIGLFASYIILFFCLGIILTKIRLDNISTSFLEEPLTARIKGHIEEMKYTERGANITLDNVIFSELLMQEKYPKKVRISVKVENIRKARIGDYIELLAYISNPSSSAIPDLYDPGKISYFKNIGATGYAMSSLEIIERRPDFGMSRIKSYLYYRLLHYLDKDRGSFATALFLGEQGSISREIMQNMRLAGVSHILCVSGLHISLIAGIFFLYSRVLLNLSNYIVFNFNVKSIGAVIGILGSFFYLLLTGSGIASIRAFIMSCLVLIGIIIGRMTLSIRSVTTAAFLILIPNPEYILFPSFQLSFIAVLSLIAGFEFYIERKNIMEEIADSFFSKAIFLNIYSTILASIATIPLVIHHFHIVSNYVILSNLLIVPLVSFVIMPIGVLSIFLSIFEWDVFLYSIMGLFINLIIKITSIISNLPGSVWYFGHIETYQLFLYLFGFFWLVIWRNMVRYWGIFLMIIAFILMIINPKKETLTSGDVKAYINEEGRLEIVGENLSKFQIDYITHYFGEKEGIYKNQKLQN